MARVLTDIEVLSRDLAAARARIAELEDWQRRAAPALQTFYGECQCIGHRMMCTACSAVRKILKEVKQ